MNGKNESRVRVQRDLAIALASTRSFLMGLQLCLDAAIQVTEMDSGGIYLRDAASGAFELTVHRGVKEPFLKAVAEYPPDSETARRMMEGRSRVFRRIDADMPKAAHLAREGILSFCSVPFRNDEGVLGCINVASHHRSRITDDDLTALEAVAAQIGGVITLLRAERALRQSEEHLRSLLETASEFAVYRLAVDPAAPLGLRVVFVSPSIRGLLGVEDPMAFETWFDHVAPAERDRILAAHRAAFDTCRFDEVLKIALPESDGPRWIHAVSNGAREPDGIIRYVNGIMLDISEQKRMEHALFQREEQLRAESKKFQEVNIALRVLLKKREEDKVGIEENVLANVNELVLPYLDKARAFVSDPKARVHLDIVEGNLREISSPFARKLTSRFFNMTPAEIQVAHLVRHGYSSKEIAAQLGISPKTVEVHRLNIRKKLGIAGRRFNLRTYLLNLG